MVTVLNSEVGATLVSFTTSEILCGDKILKKYYTFV
jgi:hypothetical protein